MNINDISKKTSKRCSPSCGDGASFSIRLRRIVFLVVTGFDLKPKNHTIIVGLEVALFYWDTPPRSSNH